MTFVLLLGVVVQVGYNFVVCVQKNFSTTSGFKVFLETI